MESEEERSRRRNGKAGAGGPRVVVQALGQRGQSWCPTEILAMEQARHQHGVVERCPIRVAIVAPGEVTAGSEQGVVI